MHAAALVTILLSAIVAVALVTMLVAIARVLVGVDRQLGVVVDAVGAIIVATEPVAEVVASIDRDLDVSQAGLAALLERKAGGAAAAAALVASVDPLAAPARAPAPLTPPPLTPPPVAAVTNGSSPLLRPAVPIGHRGGFRVPSDWQR